MDEKAGRARLDREYHYLISRDVCGCPGWRHDNGHDPQPVYGWVVARGFGRGRDGCLAGRYHGRRGAGIVGCVGDREPLAVSVTPRVRTKKSGQTHSRVCTANKNPGIAAGVLHFVTDGEAWIRNPCRH